MVNSGAKYVVVAGTFNLAKTPWSTAIGQGDLLLQASSRFNEELLVSIVDLAGVAARVERRVYVAEAMPNVSSVWLSAKTGDGIDGLRRLLLELACEFRPVAS